jgi:hypothetical protein
MEAIDMEYLLEDNQRVVDFLKAGTGGHTKVHWLAGGKDRPGMGVRKATADGRRIPRKPDIYTYVERLGINSSFIGQHYELPIAMGTSSRKKKSGQGPVRV